MIVRRLACSASATIVGTRAAPSFDEAVVVLRIIAAIEKLPTAEAASW